MFHLTIVSPQGYLHAQALAEVAESLHHAIAANGHAVGHGYNTCRPDAINIIVGSHMLEKRAMDTLPPGSILYNLEQLDDALLTRLPVMAGLFARHTVWDYSRRNLDFLRQRGLLHANAAHVPLGHAPSLSRIAPAPLEDIDVLFYGSLDAHRHAVLLAMQQAGLRVAHLFGCYGAERDGHIARSKLVLNLHAQGHRILEMARIGYLLANHKAVLSECRADTECPAGIETAIRLCPPDALVATAQALLADADSRSRLAQAGWQWWQSQDAAAVLRPHLAAAVRQNGHDAVTMPLPASH